MRGISTDNENKDEPLLSSDNTVMSDYKTSEIEEKSEDKGSLPDALPAEEFPLAELPEELVEVGEPVVASLEPETINEPDMTILETIEVPAIASPWFSDDLPIEYQPTSVYPVFTADTVLTTAQRIRLRRRRKQTRRYQEQQSRSLLTSSIMAVLAICILMPMLLGLGYGIGAYRTYTSLKDNAHNGVQHLLNVKTIFTGIQAHPTGFFDTTKLHNAEAEFIAARENFQAVQFLLNNTSVVQTIMTYLPQYQPEVISARAASQIGIDVANIGIELTNKAAIIAPNFRGSLLTDSSHPLVTPGLLDIARTTIDDMLPLLADIQTQSQAMSINTLPVSDSQKQEFLLLVQAIPQAQADLVQVKDLLDAIGWILGVNEARTFLVQTMDRAELRPTGGFTGQYGELQINGGRVGSFSLKDISLVEYVDNSPTLGQKPPAQYQSWWPIANWGLRDSNLSADFPTSAQIAIDRYQYEVGKQVDGVIVFTPFLIEDVLRVVGSIKVSGYNEVITPQNLEERLHYYQQDNAGIAKQGQVQYGDTSTSYRKLFTALLGRLLMDKVRQAPPDELIALARQMLHDLKTKDLQVYVTNAQIENLIMQYGDAATMDRSSSHDGLFVVQANVSASKASQYVKTIIHDTVTLDAAGGATHVMQLRLVYNQIGPVYGYDTYRDYVRIYVPSTSLLLWGNGFDTGQPLCGGPYAACLANGVYPGGELMCPTGLYQAGAAEPSTIDPSGGAYLPLDTIGPPTNLASDEPERGMFGGWVIVPKNCTMTVTLSWYVPPMGQQPYSIMVQRQAGMFPELDLTVLPTPQSCKVLQTSGLHVDTIMTEDTLFSVQKITSQKTGCYPTSTV